MLAGFKFLRLNEQITVPQVRLIDDKGQMIGVVSRREALNRAQEAGLDLARFKACVADGKQQAAVQKDVEEGKRLDVTGTPTFFINGRPLVGAQPLEAFARMIDDELARSGK